MVAPRVVSHAPSFLIKRGCYFGYFGAIPWVVRHGTEKKKDRKKSKKKIRKKERKKRKRRQERKGKAKVANPRV